jgi:hypothetical protein
LHLSTFMPYIFFSIFHQIFYILVAPLRSDSEYVALVARLALLSSDSYVSSCTNEL